MKHVQEWNAPMVQIFEWTRINYVFSILYSDALTSGARLIQEGLPLPGLASFWIQATCPGSVLFISNQPIQSPHLYHLLYWAFILLGHYSLAEITPGLGTRQLGTTPLPRAQWNYSNDLILNLFTLSPWFLPKETIIKPSAFHSLLPLCLWQTLVFPGVASPGVPASSSSNCSKLFSRAIISWLVGITVPYRTFLF